MASKIYSVIMGAGLLVAASGAQAAIIQVSEAAFVAGSGVITFSEKALGTTDPTYLPAEYGGGAGAPTVTFGGFFDGQALSGTPGVDCPGAAATACVVGLPTDPLTIAASSPAVFIVGDGSNPTSPVLSGTPTFDGPIVALFSTDQVGVGFDGGFFNAVGSTAIVAFDRTGAILGSVVNSLIGIEFLGLVTDDGVARIAGVALTLVGAEPAGFAIDNLRFGEAGAVVVPGLVPEPATLALFGLGLAGLGLARRRKV